MNIDDLFKIEPQKPYKMSQKEFVEKTKSVLEKIYNAYSQGWQSGVLRDGEYPEERVCDKCTGCGVFFWKTEMKEIVIKIENEEIVFTDFVITNKLEWI